MTAARGPCRPASAVDLGLQRKLHRSRYNGKEPSEHADGDTRSVQVVHVMNELLERGDKGAAAKYKQLVEQAQ